jgi:steroid delta-isomerase-like uncharacterized protein
MSDLASRLRTGFTAAFTDKDLSALDAIFSPDVVDHSAALAAGQEGLAGFKARLSGHHAGIPDLELEIFDVLVDGDRAALRWQMRGTQTSTWMGRPPSGKPVAMNGINIERLEDGLIVEHWSNPDILGALKQLGHL